MPNLEAYDPAFGYEIAVIVREGIRRMYVEQEDIFYYMTIENDPYRMPEMPDGVEEGILKGMYKFKASAKKRAKLKANLFGSGAIMNSALGAQKILEEDYKVSADVWSIPSYKALHRDCLDAERWNRMHPGGKTRLSYLEQCLEKESGVYVMASDYVKALPESIARWFPNPPVALGTDGFGRSDTRKALRRHFEVDRHYVAVVSLTALADAGTLPAKTVKDAIKKYGLDPEKPNPLYV